jgi:hypothetical protein
VEALRAFQDAAYGVLPERVDPNSVKLGKDKVIVNGKPLERYINAA